MKSSVRIIGGLFRGKKIHFTDSEGLRPTPDRIRETVFNWLMHDIRGATCLDAFAGSGALGFEALSRGAATVTLLELATDVYKCLTTQARTFNTAAIKVLNTDACHYFLSTSEQYDIIFLDPPFKSEFLMPCIEYIQLRPVLKNGGLLYIESPTEISPPEGFWTVCKAKRAGQVYYALWEKIDCALGSVESSYS